jgi:hypothetical protein
LLFAVGADFHWMLRLALSDGIEGQTDTGAGDCSTATRVGHILPALRSITAPILPDSLHAVISTLSATSLLFLIISVTATYLSGILTRRTAALLLHLRYAGSSVRRTL